VIQTKNSQNRKKLILDQLLSNSELFAKHHSFFSVKALHPASCLSLIILHLIAVWQVSVLRCLQAHDIYGSEDLA